MPGANAKATRPGSAAAAAARAQAVAPVRVARKVLAKLAEPARQVSALVPAPAPGVALAPARPPAVSFIGIGANLGNSQGTVLQAIQAIGTLQGTTLLAASSLYRTAPIDSSGPDYINAVVEISTTLGAHALLAQLQAIENKAGRARPYRNAPRTLDLDILLYDGDQAINTPSLVVPHPRMNERAFVLVPLAEIAPLQVSAGQLQAVSRQCIARIEVGHARAGNAAKD